MHFRGQPWLSQTSRTSPKRSEDPLCCLKKWWDYVVLLESAGEASTRSEWIYRLAMGSGGLRTFFFSTSQPFFAGALGRATEVSVSQATKVLHYWILLNLLHPFLFTPAATRRMTRPCHVQLALCLVRQSKAYLGSGQGLQNNRGVTLSLFLSFPIQASAVLCSHHNGQVVEWAPWFLLINAIAYLWCSSNSRLRNKTKASDLPSSFVSRLLFQASRCI